MLAPGVKPMQSLLEYKAMNIERQRRIFIELTHYT